MKFIIVDDNENRAKQIKDIINSEFNSSSCDIFYNTSSARGAMRRVSYDFLILDVVLPVLDETPDSKNGLDILKILTTSTKISKPRKIIGITAHIDDISDFRDEFQRCCFSIIEASNKNSTWKKQIIDSVKYDLDSNISRLKKEKEFLCVSVHGIRTNGDWQQSLDKLLEDNIGNVDSQIFKYGYFNAILFFIPFCRRYVIKKFSRDMSNLIKSNLDKEIYIFAHSFGTYIAVKGIDRLIKQDEFPKLNKIILSGSVLKSSHDFSLILENTNATIINDCGDSDSILLFSEAFVPYTGMAGRIGFYGLNNARFVNRYFKGGHSHYFENNKFMAKYWLPLFSDTTEVKIVDQRDKNKTSFVVKSLVGNLASLIGSSYWIIFIIVIYILIK